jgi:hypothetical protein
LTSNIYYHINNTPSINHILKQLNLAPSLSQIFFNRYFNITLTYTARFPK